MQSKKFQQLAEILSDVSCETFMGARSVQTLEKGARSVQTLEEDMQSAQKQLSVQNIQTPKEGARSAEKQAFSAQIENNPRNEAIFRDLCAYEAILRKWQPHINLIANSTLKDIWRRHILDSAQLFNFKPEAKIWLDLGSGGGFPALVIACLLKQANKEKNSDIDKAQIFLVESNGKKAGFLRNVIHQLNLPAIICQARIENALTELPIPDVITARALSSLNILCGFIAPVMARAEKNKILALLQKGNSAEQEVLEAKKFWSFDIEYFSSLIAADSVILRLKNIAEFKVYENP